MAAALSLALLGCGDPGTGDAGSTGTGAGSTTSGGGMASHALVLDVTLKADSMGQLAFLSPSNTVIEHPVSDVVGKPYLIATFHAGFAPGNDPPLDSTWGTVGADLKVHYQTDAKYADGPYDIVFVAYTATPITKEIQAGPAQSAPAAKSGDLASFTISTAEVHAGDPKNALGTLRLNVAGADASVAIENRTPAAGADMSQTLAAFTNTVLTIP